MSPTIPPMRVLKVSHTSSWQIISLMLALEFVTLPQPGIRCSSPLVTLDGHALQTGDQHWVWKRSNRTVQA